MHWGRRYRDAESILAQLDIKLDVRSQARGLTLAAQQAVEIAKAISLDVRVLIMDEPTAMPEVLAVSDRILVMREGRQMGIFNAGCRLTSFGEMLFWDR